VVALGSYNWTGRAECCNDEVLLVLHDAALAAQFTATFNRLWATKGAR
jgi:phosphatidylserine/phosphatidylglycerophosphate/cardiolipin synthase-like enzyme